MAANWTDKQKQAIYVSGRSSLVAAAAGSGKTAVLVERIIKKITDENHPVDIDRLVVVTFTKAAAAEMRQRIREALDNILESSPGNENIIRQQSLIHNAKITTIDSFCLNIVRNYFSDIDVDPGFRTADDGEIKLLENDVMDDMLEEYYSSGNEDFLQFVDAYGTGRDDSKIVDIIMKIYNAARSCPWEDEWYEECLENYLVTEKSMDSNPCIQYLFNDLKKSLEDFDGIFDKLEKICQSPDGPAGYLATVSEDHQLIKMLINSENFEMLVKRINLSSFGNIGRCSKGVDEEKKNYVKQERDNFKNFLTKDVKGKLITGDINKIYKDIVDNTPAVRMMVHLALEFSQRMSGEKKRRNVIDFNDMEHMALNILIKRENGQKIRTDAAKTLAGFYEEILIDEYQDSNLLQEVILTAVSKDGQNIYMVGDVKQSIYKFRLARPELFLEKYSTYTSEESAHQKIELHQNFRSRDHILESINAIFYRIMTEKLGNISYTEDAALHPGAAFEERDGLDELKTELLLVDLSAQPQKETESPELDDEAADYTSRELEARMIAGKIREMTDKERGITIWDKELGAYRRAQYGDIVILLRSVSGWAEEFIEVLATQGIPAVAESRTGYFNTLEVETVLNLLAVIDNPMQDIPLASVLKSPFGGISDEEMAWIVAEHKAGVDRSRDAGLYRAVVEYMNEDGPVKSNDESDESSIADAFRFQKNKLIQKNNLRRKLQKLFTLLDTFRQEAVYLPMHELLYRIYDKTGYYRYVSALPGGAGRRGNLDMLVEKAAAYEATSYRGVFHFIRYIEKLKKYNTDFGEAPVADSEGTVVRIMSIHKSKGLEFPIVFVAGMGKNFNKQDTRGKLLIDADLGIGTDYLDSEKRIKGPTLKKNVMKRRMELEALGEELRVLYVALTRAKEKLILTASSRKLEDRIAKWSAVAAEHGAIPYTILTLASSYLDWILMSIPEKNPWISYQMETLSDQIDREIGTQIRQTLSREWLRWLAGEDSHLSNDENHPNTQNRLENIRQIESIISSNYHFQYPYLDDLSLNTKMSVSELKKKGMEEEEEEMVFLPTLPVFMEKEQEEKGGATRGTAYHRVLQFLPFEQAMSRQELNAFPAKLAAEGRMDAEAAALVRGSDLAKLTASSLGKRMQRAAAAGKLYREKQFVIGIPAREMGDWDSDDTGYHRRLF